LLPLIELLGVHRFEAQVRACAAVMAARESDATAALALANRAVAIGASMAWRTSVPSHSAHARSPRPIAKRGGAC
jgi:hypothetical protein